MSLALSLSLSLSLSFSFSLSLPSYRLLKPSCSDPGHISSDILVMECIHEYLYLLGLHNPPPTLGARRSRQRQATYYSPPNPWKSLPTSVFNLIYLRTTLVALPSKENQHTSVFFNFSTNNLGFFPHSTIWNWTPYQNPTGSILCRLARKSIVFFQSFQPILQIRGDLVIRPYLESLH